MRSCNGGGRDIGLIALACLVAHLAPAATLLGAYAILGPAHYLTEISWLQDRHYFARGGIRTAGPLALLALGFLVAGATPLACGALGAAIALSVVTTIRDPGALALALSLAAGAIVYAGARAGSPAILVAALLIPTIVHVAGFTVAFMVRGAMRGPGRTGWIVIAAMVAAAASFLVLPSGTWLDTTPPHLVDRTFGSVLQAVAIPNWRPGLQGMLGLLGFAYLHHYLNWFSKTGSVGWHRVGRGRLAVMVGAWMVVSAAYLRNFEFGFLLSLPLSVAHVFLEFPLNVSTLRSIVLNQGRPGLGDGAARDQAQRS